MWGVGPVVPGSEKVGGEHMHLLDVSSIPRMDFGLFGGLLVLAVVLVVVWAIARVARKK